MNSDLTDADLIRESLTSQTIFGEIFDRHHDRIYVFVARRVGANQAADVTSEVFLTAFRIRERYDFARPSCLPWLYGIAQNLIGDLLRKTRRSQRVYLHRQADTRPVETSLADNRLVADALAGDLNRALSKLSEGDRNALLLYAVESLTYAEIGVTLAIPAGTVGSRLARARRKIREAIPNLQQIVDVNPEEGGR